MNSVPDAGGLAARPASSAAPSPGFAPASVERPDLVSDGCVELWAVQAPVVADAVRRDGVAHVKKEYIQGKYREGAFSFSTAYGWFSPRLAQAVPQPAEAESPYWLYRDRAWATAGADSVFMRLSVPADAVVLFDLRRWNRVLSLEYVETCEDDARAFAADLSRWGLAHASQAFSSPAFPLVRRAVERSWDRLAGSAVGCPETYLQGAVWELRQEWVCALGTG